MAVSRMSALCRWPNGSRMMNMEPKFVLLACNTNDMPVMPMT